MGVCMFSASRKQQKSTDFTTATALQQLGGISTCEYCPASLYEGGINNANDEGTIWKDNM